MNRQNSDPKYTDTTKEAICLLVGNPNVGKSSLFNKMTGLRRHTGNWVGKSIDCAVAKAKTPKGCPSFYVADLPGCYSLLPATPEEEETLSFIRTASISVAVVVCEVGCLARNLLLAYQLKALDGDFDIFLCINLIDEARRTGWHIDASRLSEITGFPVFLTSAQTGEGVANLVHSMSVAHTKAKEKDKDKQRENASCGQEHEKEIPSATTYYAITKEICAQTVSRDENLFEKHRRRHQAINRIFMSKPIAISVSLLLLFSVFWLTIYGANGPSALLSLMFSKLSTFLKTLPLWTYFPSWVEGLLIEGIWATLTQVVSVMLPPMAIFFPLFTLMEDIGLLPRIAFHADACFCRCGTGGKQALTICMSCGCHSVGVMGCRIISDKKERLAAILTSSLVPCNGKFPTLLAIISALLLNVEPENGISVGNSLLSAGILTCIILLTICCTWFATFLIQKALLGGEVTPFIMEIPPFRRPRIGHILIRSILDRTIFVLGRAVAVAAPVGGIIWLCGYITVENQSILLYITDFLDPIGVFLGVDGAILVSLLLSAVANELALPTLFTIYGMKFALTAETMLLPFAQHPIVAQWNISTLICFTFLFLFHAPCTTTLWTIKKETGKWKYVLLSVAIPVFIGIGLCLAVQAVTFAIRF